MRALFNGLTKFIILGSEHLNITIVNIQFILPLDHEEALPGVLHFDLNNIEAKFLALPRSKLVRQDIEHLIFLIESNLLDETNIEFPVNVDFPLLGLLHVHVDIDAIHVGSDHKDRLFDIGAEERWLSQHFVVLFELVQDRHLGLHKVQREYLVLLRKYDLASLFSVLYVFKVEVHASLLELGHILENDPIN